MWKEETCAAIGGPGPKRKKRLSRFQMKALSTELAMLKKRGLVKPVNVVEFARQNPESALHAMFEWDDSKAAHEYRLIQARHILVMFVTEVRTVDAEGKTIFVETSKYTSLSSDRQGAGGGYREIGDVLADPALRERMLADARRDVAYFVQKYEVLSELAPIVKVMKGFAAGRGKPKKGGTRKGKSK